MLGAQHRANIAGQPIDWVLGGGCCSAPLLGTHTVASSTSQYTPCMCCYWMSHAGEPPAPAPEPLSLYERGGQEGGHHHKSIIKHHFGLYLPAEELPYVFPVGNTGIPSYDERWVGRLACREGRCVWVADWLAGLGVGGLHQAG